CTLPCVGMADVNWIKEFLANGAKDVALVSCPYDDCNYREGPQWESSRLRRRKALLKPNLHWLEVAPGESRPVAALLDTLHQTSAQETPPALPTTSKARLQAKPRALAAGLGLLLLTLLFALAVPLELPGGTLAAENSQLRITLEHGGVMISTVDASKYTLPEGVSAAEIMGGERHPVQLRLEIDGALALEKTYEPAGLRREGDIVELEVLPLSPGVHQITIQIKDDDGEWREVFTGEIEAPVAEVVDLAYDEEADTFELLKIGK
ncbi:MAG: hydrogenase iron-sulfur subunit, partial [Gammaproteobacteria bacterium]|nr:hydrogenase iron-sulfur subunit [Gammaproteobacteria bacterium]